MNFLLLCIQSTVCVGCVLAVKKLGVISFRTFDVQDAKAWFPISFLLVTVIYTGSKSLVCPAVISYEGRDAYLASAISIYSRVYDIQEPDHHPHRTYHSCRAYLFD